MNIEFLPISEDSQNILIGTLKLYKGGNGFIFQEVIEELKELGGGKVDTRKSLLFHNDGNNMAVSLKDVSEGWNLSRQCEKDIVSISKMTFMPTATN